MSETPGVGLPDLLQAARDAHARREWPRAYELFAAADQSGELSADDLHALSASAWWLGLRKDCVRAAEAAYHRYLADERREQAALAAVDVAVEHLLQGDEVVGSGWMHRAQRALGDRPEGVVHGLLLYLQEVEGPLGGVAPSAPVTAEGLIASARRVAEIGRRCGNADLVACGTLGEGRALVKLGRVADGLALLDEAMAAVLSDELSPELAGNLYCHLMSAAHELGDLRRSVAWTEATARWVEGLPVAVLFTGICRVHRSQVHQVTGAWDRAEQEAARVCADLADLQPAAAAEGSYQLGEIRRLRGDLPGAEAAYQHAHRLGRDPQPGYALLRLAQGNGDAAAASIRAALMAETDDRLARARLCAAQVEIALTAGDLPGARKACEELEDVASAFGSSGLQVTARHARGAVLLAEGRPGEALPVLRDACRRWHALEAPYDCARVRVVLARAYAELGDADAAALERDAAAEVFERLGAAADLRTVTGLQGHGRRPDGLTEREVEVLARVAVGRTNREVAADLVISEKTVARHLSNIFTKVGVSSRTAAAAYAYEHELVPRPDR